MSDSEDEDSWQERELAGQVADDANADAEEEDRQLLAAYKESHKLWTHEALKRRRGVQDRGVATFPLKTNLLNSRHDPAARSFAFDTVRAFNEYHRQVQMSKRFAKGNSAALFSYAQDLGCPAWLDECIPPNQPTRLYLDVELKQTIPEEDKALKQYFISATDPNDDHVREWKGGRVKQGRLNAVLREHVLGILPHLTPDGVAPTALDDSQGIICEDLSVLYPVVVGRPFTEDECKAGLRVIRGDLTKIIRKCFLGHFEDRNNEERMNGLLQMNICTSCREDKFSLHIVMPQLYCESVVLSMTTIVHEMARHLEVANIHWLLQNQSAWETDEGSFRIRCMSLERQKNLQSRFTGFNVGPIDEAVYREWGLMRAPGTVKAGAQHALRPLRSDLDQMLSQGMPTKFDEIFRDNQAGINEWLEYTISACGEPGAGVHPDSKPVLFIGWSSVHKNPRAPSYLRYKEKYKGLFSIPRRFENAFKIVQAPPDSRRRFLDHRRTRFARDDAEEMALRAERPSGVFESHEIAYGETYHVEETNQRAHLRDIDAGFMIRHKHGEGGAEETRASASVRHHLGRVGFFCHACNAQFWEKVDDAEDRYDVRFSYRDEEIIEAQLKDGGDTTCACTQVPGSADDKHHAFISCPNNANAVQWYDRMNKQLIVIDANMGSGKSNEVSLGLMF